jgi:hypothetical protein
MGSEDSNTVASLTVPLVSCLLFTGELTYAFMR